MEITSPAPEPVTITVTDVDIRFLGESSEVTLFPDDTIVENDKRIEISYRARPEIGRQAETIVINAAHVLWISRRERTITLPPTDDQHPSV